MEIIQKASEDYLKLGIDQTNLGIELDIWVHPLVEAYFKASSNSRSNPVESEGNQAWYSPKTPLMVYRTNAKVADGTYSFLYAGFDFSPENIGLGLNGVNLAFLRLVGASDGNGVRLGVRTAMSTDARRELKHQIGINFRKFLRDHLTKVRLELTVSGREF